MLEFSFGYRLIRPVVRPQKRVPFGAPFYYWIYYNTSIKEE